MKTALLANGDFPVHERPLKILKEADNLVVCDGAARYGALFGRGDYYVVGDGDSISPELRVSLGDRFVHNPDQETNDLTKAMRFCVEKGWRDIDILGATGLREDHTLGNIGLLADYFSDWGLEVRMVTNHGVFTPINTSTEFESFPSQQVSLFSLSADSPLTVEGLRYPINRRCLTRLWQGTLNESLGDRFTVAAEGLLLVYQTFE